MATRLLPWTVAGFVLTFAGAQALCVSHRDVGNTPDSPAEAHELPDLPAPEESPRFVDPPTPLETIPRPSRRDWCEPLVRPTCEGHGAECPTMPDGTLSYCTRAGVCVAKRPPRDIRRWRRDRQRTIVDAVCKRGDHCAPQNLALYLAAIINRETGHRPWLLHRLPEDTRAAMRVWSRRAPVFADSPAHDEPARWSSGMGYFGQNPALLLDRWDASAEPETLCGEVESVIVHLRTARKRWRRLHHGVTCDGEEFHGTAIDGGPSWYDISLANSGSNACPGASGDRLAKRLSFGHRAERIGLNPYGRVTRKMLGSPVEVSVQDQFAEDLRAKLDAEHPIL